MHHFLAGRGRYLAVFLASIACLSAVARETIIINRGWKFQLGDHPGAEASGYDASLWDDIHLPHTFSRPYFMWTGFYTGYGWYRKTLDVPTAWTGKRVAIEFEAAFQNAEIFVNGMKIGAHRGGYVGFTFDLTPHIRPGLNSLAVRIDNLWRADLAPRAGDHTFSGGIYRDVRLVVTDPVHVAWFGTYVTTPTLAENAGAESTVRVRTEVNNSSATDQLTVVRNEILDPDGAVVATVSSKLTVPSGATVTFDQTTAPVARPALWSPDSPRLYRVSTTVFADRGVLRRDRPVDTYETRFGFRWFEWTADRGFFLNGKHVWLAGANVHQDHAGWGDGVTNAAHLRDVRMVKEAGFNFIRGSHYPKDPAFGEACDRLGVLWISENVFWGMGGRQSDGAWNASAYPITPADEFGFEESVLHSLRSMIRIHRNSPSIIGWSVSNEAFFSDRSVMPKVAALLRRSVDLGRQLDPTRPVGVGGAQRPLDQDRIDRIGDFAAYNGDGATQPAFQNPGVPSLVSEYGSVVTDRPGKFDPGWGDLRSQLKDGRPERLVWRSGEAVWCMYDHGSHGGLNLARMGIVDYFRLPKRAFYWYRENYAGVPAPAWPIEGKAAKIELVADKTTLAAPDGTDDAQLIVTLLDASGARVNDNRRLTLSVVSGPGEFPTGPTITFSPAGSGDASDIAIREGQAAIAFRSYHAGETMIRAEAEGLPPVTLALRTLGAPAYEPGLTPPVAARPYARFHDVDASGSAAFASKPGSPDDDVFALNRPTKASSSAEGAPSALANDGSPKTVWRATPDVSGLVTWEVFLEAAYDVDRVTLVFPEKAAYRFIIEVSSDGAASRRVIDQSDNRIPIDRAFASADFGKKIDTVRVRFIAGPGEPVPALSEVLVGGGGSAALPVGRLGGVVVGTPGSWNNTPFATREAAFDGRLGTAVDAVRTDDAWTGLDLGVGCASRVNEILFAPRGAPGNDAFPARMVGGRFQGATRSDFSDARDLAIVSETPRAGAFTRLATRDTARYRYLRYLSPRGGFCNVAEIIFLGETSSLSNLVAP